MELTCMECSQNIPVLSYMYTETRKPGVWNHELGAYQGAAHSMHLCFLCLASATSCSGIGMGSFALTLGRLFTHFSAMSTLRIIKQDHLQVVVGLSISS